MIFTNNFRKTRKRKTLSIETCGGSDIVLGGLLYTFLFIFLVCILLWLFLLSYLMVCHIFHWDLLSLLWNSSRYDKRYVDWNATINMRARNRWMKKPKVVWIVLGLSMVAHSTKKNVMYHDSHAGPMSHSSWLARTSCAKRIFRLAFKLTFAEPVGGFTVARIAVGWMVEACAFLSLHSLGLWMVQTMWCTH